MEFFFLGGEGFDDDDDDDDPLVSEVVTLNDLEPRNGYYLASFYPKRQLRS